MDGQKVGGWPKDAAQKRPPCHRPPEKKEPPAVACAGAEKKCIRPYDVGDDRNWSLAFISPGLIHYSPLAGSGSSAFPVSQSSDPRQWPRGPHSRGVEEVFFCFLPFILLFFFLYSLSGFFILVWVELRLVHKVTDSLRY